MRDLPLERPLVARAVACALFVLAASAFVLPFLHATADARVGDATGIDLVAGEPAFGGRYVHGAYEGEVERVFAEADGPALLAFAALLAGAVAVWLPWRAGAALALGAALAGAGALYVLHQTAGTAFAEATARSGFWLAALLTLAVAGWTAAMAAWSPWWWRPPRDEGRRDYFASPGP